MAMTEAQLVAGIRAIATRIRGRGQDARGTDEENTDSLALKQELDILRNPPPLPPPPPTLEERRRLALRGRMQAMDLTLAEVNELLRLEL